MLLQGIGTLLGLRFDFIWFGITLLKANVLSDLHNIAGLGKLQQREGARWLVRSGACD